MAVNKAWARTGLTGGTSTDLDGIGVASLTNEDMAFINYEQSFYTYEYDSSSTAVESSPDVIKPDDAGSNGRWLLRKTYGNYGQNELINPNFAIDQEVNLGTSTSATNYYVDGWFNPSGAASGSLNNVGVRRFQLSGTNKLAQFFGKILASGSTQIHGIIDNEPLTVTVKMFSGTLDVYAGYGTNSASALTTVNIGSVSTSSQSISYLADNDGTLTNNFVIVLEGSGIFEWVKVERGTSATVFVEPKFRDSLRECEFFYKKSYSYSIAPGTISNTGAISFRNTTGIASSNLQGIPAKSDNMYQTPSVLLYSPATGTSNVIRNDTISADVGVIAVVYNGKNGFSSLTTATTVADNDSIAFHYVYDARY